MHDKVKNMGLLGNPREHLTSFSFIFAHDFHMRATHSVVIGEGVQTS